VGTYHIEDDGAGVAQNVAAAYVQRYRDVLGAGALQGGVRFAECNGRKVLDAVKPEILKGFNRLALPGAGEAGYEDDTRTHMKPFSRERANALIPKVAPLLTELLAKRRDLAIKLLESDPALRHAEPQRAQRLAGVRSPFPPPRFGELKVEIHRLIARIESLGCIVKDIDLGLIDFPAVRAGEEVYLCWKLGEARVAYWHGTDEGFASRKAL
jgi:hypothetical protein